MQRLTSQTLFLACSILILLGIIWGSGYSIARYALTHGVSPLGYAFWQSMGPAIVLTLITKTAHLKFRLRWTDLRFYIICGLLGIALPNTNMYFAAPHLPAGLLGIIINTVPVFIFPIALLVKEERFDALRFMGVLVGSMGIFILVSPNLSLPALNMSSWALVALISPLSFAVVSVYISRATPPETNVLVLSSAMLWVSGIVITPIVIAEHQFYSLHFPITLTDAIVLLEIILSSIGYVLFFILLKIAGPVFYSLVGGIVALTSLAWGGIVFHEVPNGWALAATALILTAIVMVSLRQGAQKRAIALDISI
jgi:drug/metabolite transporter (DMT)-like permease